MFQFKNNIVLLKCLFPFINNYFFTPPKIQFSHNIQNCLDYRFIKNALLSILKELNLMIAFTVSKDINLEEDHQHSNNK